MNLRPITPGEDAVLSVLAGTTIEIAAAQANTTPNRLADAIERYRAAGRAALDHQPDGWYQVSVEFADYPTAERAVRVHLLPALHRESVGSWWFVRKHPCWRLRVHAAPGADIDDAVGHISHALDNAASLGAIKRWWTSLYEPETVAFGGPAGMAISHALFHTDSLGVLKHRQRGEKGARRPLDSKATSLLVTTLLLRAAGLEWGEQGDVWGRVEAARPLPDDVKPRKVSGMVNALRRLLLVDAGPCLPTAPDLAAHLGDGDGTRRPRPRGRSARRTPPPRPARHPGPAYPLPLEPYGIHHAPTGDLVTRRPRGCPRPVTRETTWQ